MDTSKPAKDPDGQAPSAPPAPSAPVSSPAPAGPPAPAAPPAPATPTAPTTPSTSAASAPAPPPAPEPTPTPTPTPTPAPAPAAPDSPSPESPAPAPAPPTSPPAPTPPVPVLTMPPSAGIPPDAASTAPEAEGAGRKPWLWIAGSVIVVAALAAAVWFWFIRPVSTATPERTVKIGLLAPLTGDNLSVGNGIRRAIQLARKDISLQNAKIEVIEKDSNCDATTAEKATKELIEQHGVVAVIGDYCSSSTLAALKLATQHKVVLISPAATSPELSGASPYFFRTVPTDIQQGEFAAKLMHTKGYKRVAIIHDDDAYGVGLAKSFSDNLKKLGSGVVTNEVFPAESVDVDAQLRRVKAARPDALYIISVSFTSDKSILQTIRTLGITAKLYGSEALKDQTFIDDSGDLAEGLIVTALPDGNTNYIDNHQAQFNARPAIYSAQTYDAYSAIAKGIAAGTYTGEALKDHLKTIDFVGVSSPIKFSATGDISAGTYEVVTVKDKKFVLSGE